MKSGAQLIEELKAHVIETMEGMPECRPGIGPGAGYRLVEEISGLGLDLQGQDGWLSWSLLMSMAQDGVVEIVPGTERRRKYRLA